LPHLSFSTFFHIGQTVRVPIGWMIPKTESFLAKFFRDYGNIAEK